MDKYSYLGKTFLVNKCNECIYSLQKDIEDHELVKSQLDAIISEGSLKGQAFTAFKNQLEDYTNIKIMSIEADEKDIADLNTVIENVTDSYNGDLIITSYEDAKADRDSNQGWANHYRALALVFNTTVITIQPIGIITQTTIPNPFQGLADMYQQNANSAQAEMDLWQAKMDEFDAIEAATATLACSGNEIRTIVKRTLNAMNRQSIKGFYDKKVAYIGRPDDTLIDPDWLTANGCLYGLSDTEIRFLEEYYPNVVNELYSACHSGQSIPVQNVMDKIDGILSVNYVDMMTDNGYSYEAICYLLDNDFDLLYELSVAENQEDIARIKRQMYEACQAEYICVYDPVYDFDAYNIDIDNFDYENRLNEVQRHTNCYSYAFGIVRDPRTGELLPEGGLQPGFLSGREDEFSEKFDEIFSCSDSNNGELLVDFITSDANAIGLNFVPYEEGMTGGVRVSLVIDPINFTGENPDYHWYFYDEETGSYFNKQGSCPATDKYIDFNNIYYYVDGQTVLTDDMAILYGYPGLLISGYTQEIGNDYYSHATSCGKENDYKDNYYEINVGEFYITRMDGGEFN